MVDSGHQPKKSLGQHWLHHESSLNAMCDIAEVNPGEVILEIGPGLGTLTQKLLDRGTEVVALEFDESLIAPLQIKFSHYNSSRFRVEHGDIRTYNFSNVAPDKVVANIPYYLTSHLITILARAEYPKTSATLLIQKEVAERVCADPGDMSLLSVSAQMYFECFLGPVVPAELFTPPPKVDSQVIHLRRRPRPLFDEESDRDVFRVIKAGFSNRRKTLSNSLSAGMHISKDDANQLLESAGISPQSRPQELSLEQWIALYKASNS